MLDLHEEQPSLDAIRELEEEYPYAASMLAYLVLELYLKLYLLQYRKTLTAKEVNFGTTVGRENKKIKLGDAKNLDDTSFIQRFLVNCALGDLEKIYYIPRGKYSTHRNKVFHGNLYLADQLGRDYEFRVSQNRAYLETAKKHLIEASKLYFPQWTIVELNGQLQFRDARRLPLS
jgi:hypothetical protein